MAFVRVRVSDVIAALLVISVTYQTLQMISYRSSFRPHHEGRETHPSSASLLASGTPGQTRVDVREQAEVLRVVRSAVRKSAGKKALAVGHGKPGPKKAGSAGQTAGMRMQKDLEKASHRMGWLPQADGSAQEEVDLQGGVLVEAISQAEAEQMQQMAERLPRGEGEQEDGRQAEMEDAGETQEGNQRDRPVTLGGEPRWHHPMSGSHGGIGPPVEEGGERLYLRDRYHFHLHQKQFETDGRRGGWLGTNGKPRSAILRYPVTMADGTQTFDQTQFWSEDLDSLPYNDSAWRFATCAIVSNSGSLLNAEFGQEIDEHDAVIRINHAPVQGFRRFVGVKTTFDLCNRPHAQRLSKMSVLRKNQQTSLVLFESTNWNVYYRLYRQVFRSFPFPGTVVLSPDLLMAAMSLWKKLASRFPKHAYSCSAIKRAASQGLENKRCQVMKHDCDSTICKPSSGFFALVFASQMCNRVTMYGFEAYRFNSKMVKSTKYHYFDDETGTTNVHSFVLLMKVFQYLESLYPTLTLRLSEEGMIDAEGDAARRMFRSYANASVPVTPTIGWRRRRT